MLSALIGLIYLYSTRPITMPVRSTPSDYTQALEVCTTNTIKTLKLVDTDFFSYQRIWSLCGNQIYDLDYLVDFDIRREKLLRQELDERVILWMVVAITMSGVILAGFQLFASYRLALASAHHDSLSAGGEFSIEAGKLSLKSSVTGLLILAISLVLFVVYVKWVYMTQELNMEKPASLMENVAPSISGYGSLSPSPAPSISGYGSLSPPPTMDKNSSKVTEPSIRPIRPSRQSDGRGLDHR